VTVVTYKDKTVRAFLNEIAGLLVLTSILTFLLSMFNEWSFDRKIMKEANEDFREVFTYQNFKKTMVQNQESKAQIEKIEAENQEMKVQIQEMEAEN
jgi:hypothetical protein